MSQTSYTVFSDDGFQDNGDDQGEFAGVGLQALIDLFAKRWPRNHLIAWTTENVYARGAVILQMETEVAGRLIQYDEARGKYIPLGAVNVDGEWKSASELFIVDSKTPTLDKMEAESEEAFDAIYKGFLEVLAKNKFTEPIGDDYDEGDDWRTPEPIRPALDWNKPADTNRFPGFTVTSHCANEPKACGLHSPDLKQSSHQVAAVFGSAELVRR